MANKTIPQGDIPMETPMETPMEVPKELPVLEMHRLTASAYQKVEAAVAPPTVNNNTTPTSAAYQLGVQSVLRVLRDGYVVGR